MNTEGTFTWEDGTEFYKAGAVVAGAFTNLFSAFSSSSQETQDCLQLRDDGTWDDVLCTKTLNFVCQKPAYIGANTYQVNTE